MVGMTQAGPVDSRREGARLRSRRLTLVVASVIVVVIAAAGSLELFAWLAPTPGPNCGSTSGPTPLGSGFAIGSPSPSGGPSNRSYSMTLIPEAGVRWSDLAFEVVNSNGAMQPALPSWGVLAVGMPSPDGQPTFSYSFQTQTWSPGATQLIWSGETMSLELGSSDLRGQGDNLVVEIAIHPTPCGNSSGGSASVALP